jgi:hypothetical protein
VSSLLTGLYDPQTFITHAASLHQACAHCARFPDANSRRSLDHVSVPMWLIVLSDQLSIVALVSRYLTNKLMDRGPISKRRSFTGPRQSGGRPSSISRTFVLLSSAWRHVIHVLLTRLPLNIKGNRPKAITISMFRSTRIH